MSAVPNSIPGQIKAEHPMNFEKLVLPDNYSGDKVISPIADINPNGGEMSSEAGLHKNFVRQGPQHRYGGDMRPVGKRNL